MKFLIVTVIYLLSGCGSPPAPHSEAQMARLTRQAVSQAKLLMRRTSPNKITGKFVEEGQDIRNVVGGKIIPPSRGHMPVEELVTTSTPTEWFLQHTKKKKPYAVARSIAFNRMGASFEEANQHIKQRKTFFHIFFTMRDSVGGDMELFNKLNLKSKLNKQSRKYEGNKLNIKVETYFDLMQRPRFLEPEELQQIITGVAANKDLKDVFLSDLLNAASIESAIKEGALDYHLGDRVVRNIEINASLRQRLHKLYAQAERDVQLKMLRQPELEVKWWLRRGSIVNELLLEMQEAVGGRKELAALLGMRELLVSKCMQRGAREEKTITAIITKIRNLDGRYMLKSFVDELETSLVMEKAIDAGAVAAFDMRHGQRIRLVDAETLRSLQQTLHQRRLAFTARRN